MWRQNHTLWGSRHSDCVIVWRSSEVSKHLQKTQMCFFFQFTSMRKWPTAGLKVYVICVQTYLPFHDFVSILGDRCGKCLWRQQAKGLLKSKSWDSCSSGLFIQQPTINEWDCCLFLWPLWHAKIGMQRNNELSEIQNSAEWSLSEVSLPPSDTKLLRHLR